jgi:hypothetical protein
MACSTSLEPSSLHCTKKRMAGRHCYRWFSQLVWSGVPFGPDIKLASLKESSLRIRFSGEPVKKFSFPDSEFNAITPMFTLDPELCFKA